MFVSTTRLAALALSLGLLSAAAFAPANVETLVGKPAPEIKLKTVDGKDVALSSLKGKVVLVDFWATWCPPCRASLPNINAISNDKALAGKGLIVWAVNLGEGPDAITPFAKKQGFTLTVPMDSDGKTAEGFGVEGIPSTLVIGADGTVKFAVEGFGGEDTEKQIKAAIDKELASK